MLLDSPYTALFAINLLSYSDSYGGVIFKNESKKSICDKDVNLIFFYYHIYEFIVFNIEQSLIGYL
jgi:hypothetical protein